MAIKNIIQPNTILIDDYIRLKTPSKSEWHKALPWYQNRNVLYYSEGVEDKVYNLDIINRMYSYLSDIGELYFIEILESLGFIEVDDNGRQKSFELILD